VTDAVTAQLELLAGLVSSKTGIIRRMNRRITAADEPPVPMIYDSLLSHFDFKTGEDLERGACGKGMTEAAAQIGAIGEAIEHYCASHARLKRVRRARFAELPNAIAPPDFVLYSEAQYTRTGFRHARWEPGSETAWFEVIELPDRTPVWIPAGLVYLNFVGQQPQDFLCPPTSSGSAAGPDVDTAILSGLLEVAERDAFLMTWMNRLPVPTLDYSGLGGPCGIIRDHYARYGVEARAFLLATDLPLHAVMAIGLDHTGNGPAAVVGLGCHGNPETALRRALFEVCQVRPAERKKFGSGDADKLNAYTDVHTLDEHALYFTRADHLMELDFLLSGAATVRVDDLPDRSAGSVQSELQRLVGALRRMGSRPVYAELTTPDLEDFPISVVRTLATDLQPIAFGHDQQRLGGQRLYELPRKLGYSPERGTESNLNPCPHPLA
jgi:ribosomal protein S12 methylthiotransferase accessory factor